MLNEQPTRLCDGEFVLTIVLLRGACYVTVMLANPSPFWQIMSGLIFGLGNPLLDISASVDAAYLEQYGLKVQRLCAYAPVCTLCNASDFV